MEDKNDKNPSNKLDLHSLFSRFFKKKNTPPVEEENLSEQDDIHNSESSPIKNITDKIVEFFRLEDEVHSEKGSPLKKINSYFAPFQNRIQSEFKELIAKLPLPVQEKIQEENTVYLLLGILLLISLYIFNYSPYVSLQREKVILKQEQERHKIFEGKLITVKNLLKERQHSSEVNQKKFDELRDSFIFNQFEDSLSVSEYLQEVIEKYKIQVNSIGPTAVEQAPPTPAPSEPKTAQQKNPPTEDVNALLSTDNSFPVQGVNVQYDITGNFADIEGFLTALEDGRVFVDSKNTPIVFNLLSEDKLNMKFNLLAYLDMNKLRAKALNHPEFPKDDLSLKKMIFSKSGSENIRKTFQSAKIFKMNSGYHAILKLANGKTFILKNDQTFQENDEKYAVEIKNNILKVVNLENDDTLELKNEVQEMKND